MRHQPRPVATRVAGNPPFTTNGESSPRIAMYAASFRAHIGSPCPSPLADCSRALAHCAFGRELASAFLFFQGDRFGARCRREPSNVPEARLR